jgi:leucyl-tRNA synthetase
MEGYPYKKIESDWQKKWDEMGLYRTSGSPERKYYLLEMYPYPSGDLHLGQFKNYLIGDVITRKKMMEGYDLLHPMGWDAFGLPAENRAIQYGIHPEEWTLNNIRESKQTLQLMGITYDWEREVTTCLPDYYKWNQWLFLKLFEKGMAYRGRSFVNWCSNCQTVLANEQVKEGHCERCDTPITKRDLEQWFFKITAYAEKLLQGLDELEGWSERVKTIQRNWIGKSTGTEVDFPLEKGEKISVFTTRPDTLFGVTFMAIAPENPLARELVKGKEREREVLDYIETSLNRTEIERTSTTREKDGVFTGENCINPLSGEKVQLWVADYVLSSYGTGIVMGVPAHDQRDFEFAKQYGIPIKVVIQPVGERLDPEEMEEAYVEPGVMTNSDTFNDVPSEEGKSSVTKKLIENDLGRSKVNYRIRDWLISRQRYWGTPIPMIHCEKCGIVPVPEKDLPVLLPKEEVDFLPKGRSPLTSVKSFMEVSCPSCKGKAERDPDTMDTFVDSSWYHLRYADPKNEKEIFSKPSVKTWLPIDQYIGGIEHAAGHLIYFRFVTKFLHEQGLIPYEEPCKRLFNHGMVMDKDGDVMSKSKGNAVPVGPFVEEWGADTGRITMLFIGPPGSDSRWSEEGVVGSSRFLNRIYRFFEENREKIKDAVSPEGDDLDLFRKLNKTIKKVTEDIDNLGHNTAIAALMEFLNELTKGELSPSDFKKTMNVFIRLLAPFAPHLAEELWNQIGEKESVFRASWPEYEETMLKEDEIPIVVQVNGKLRAKLILPSELEEEKVKEAALGHENIKRYVEGKSIKKVIFVPEKLVNVVVE